MFSIEIFLGSSVKRILLENAKISTGTPCGGLNELSYKLHISCSEVIETFGV